MSGPLCPFWQMFCPARKRRTPGPALLGKAGLVSLSYEEKTLCGISLCSLPVHDRAGEPAHSSPAQDTSAAAPAVPKPERLSGSRVRQLQKDNSEIRQLLFLAEQYLGRTLSPTDISRILYFYDVLHFPMDLLEYLIEYCVSEAAQAFIILKSGTGMAPRRNPDCKNGPQNTYQRLEQVILFHSESLRHPKQKSDSFRNGIYGPMADGIRILSGYYRGGLLPYRHADRAAQFSICGRHSVQLEAAGCKDSRRYLLSGRKAQGKPAETAGSAFRKNDSQPFSTISTREITITASSKKNFLRNN